jgi:hypothetical protein
VAQSVERLLCGIDEGPLLAALRPSLPGPGLQASFGLIARPFLLSLIFLAQRRGEMRQFT